MSFYFFIFFSSPFGQRRRTEREKGTKRERQALEREREVGVKKERRVNGANPSLREVNGCTGVVFIFGHITGV